MTSLVADTGEEKVFTSFSVALPALLQFTKTVQRRVKLRLMETSKSLESGSACAVQVKVLKGQSKLLDESTCAE